MRLPRPDLRPDGRCVRIPGQDRIPERARVRSFPLVEQDAFLWIWMGDPAKADPATIVSYPWHNDTVNWPHKHTMYPIKASAMLMVDNLMDLTHLGYVHGSTIGGNPMTHVEAKMETVRTPLGLKFTRWMLNSVPPPTYVRAVGLRAASTGRRCSSSSRPDRSCNSAPRMRPGPTRTDCT